MEELYDGSLAYYRGDLENARVLTYKAIYLLEKTKQDVLQISAGEQLAMIATRQGDVNGFEEAVTYLDAAAERSTNREACACLVTLIRSGLFNTLGKYQDTPGWLKMFSYASGSYGTGPFGDKNIAGNTHFAPVSFGVACWFHVQYLAESGQYLRAVAALEVLLQRIFESEGVLILELYLTLLAACCYMALGSREKAYQYVEKAVALALPDGFIMPLGNFSQHLDGMVEEALKKKDKSALSVLRRINDIYVSGIRALQTEYLTPELPGSLTRREQEVARLAAKGYHNSEIAGKLSVSESTVRAHLRSVFQKLNIDRRAKLAQRFKEKAHP
jgi:LuxR family maltose regulon positive regulatory protein